MRESVRPKTKLYVKCDICVMLCYVMSCYVMVIKIMGK